MRALALITALAAAGPGFAQTPPTVLPSIPVPNPAAQPQYSELLAAQELARQQAIAQQNQLMSTEAQLKAQQAVQSTRGLRLPDHIPPPPATGAGAAPNLDVSQLASIPDSVLADSNKKVLEASKPPR